MTFLIAQEVNDCDDVAGWRGDKEILMSEEEATNTQDLILFVGPGKGLAISDNGSFADIPTLEISTQSITNNLHAGERGLTTGEQLRVVNGKIKGLNYRYEKSGSSEIIAFVTGWEDDPTQPRIQTNKQAEHKFSKKEIQNQVTVSINRSLADIIESAAATNLFIGFYEYDWYIASRNLIPVSCPCNSSVADAQLAMKYKHEWYNTDKFCGRLTTLIPNATGSKTLDNYKGTFVVKRQPL